MSSVVSPKSTPARKTSPAPEGNPFVGRTLAVVQDMSLDEQWYLYTKTRELKELIRMGGDVSEFQMDDPQIGSYLIFMEDSTRTKESFRNAAKFHNIKLNDFDCKSSSFNKKESISDTIKMLFGYSSKRSVFIIRSKHEGVCRWLETCMEGYAEKLCMPAATFLNAGDGRHEHPTQELLDEFTFLENNAWNREHIHIALVGDLFHGRTVHSKVDGLRIFRSVEVDLVAPEDIAMPPEYEHRMVQRGFIVRKFNSIEEYVAQERVAKLWYFTRLQLERMGEKVKDRESSLRTAVSFAEQWIPAMPEGTKFFHPLPRHSQYPTIPTFLDDTRLNGWDQQAMNGYFTRIALLALVTGKLGRDFKGEPRQVVTFDGDFVEVVPVVRPQDAPKEFKVGIMPIEGNGVVIDHIAQGQPISYIWDRIDMVRRILGLNTLSSHGVYDSRNSPGKIKGVISLPMLEREFQRSDLKRLAAISPGCTLNLISGARVVQKYRLHMPPRIYNFRDISCKNDACVSFPGNFEGAIPEFWRQGTQTFVCKYCERPHKYSDIWDA